MGITKDSKETLSREIERLNGQKEIVVQRIKKLGDKKDQLVMKRDALTAEIQNMKTDTGE